MATVIKPKPGKYKGIQFRSQLEIEWAKWFDSHAIKWEYIDTATHDFKCQHFGTVEIKPRDATVIAAAAERIWHGNDGVDTVAQIIIGAPPSIYGNPIMLHVVLLDERWLLMCFKVLTEVHNCVPVFGEVGWYYSTHDDFEGNIANLLAEAN